jgi:hypothetical protein
MDVLATKLKSECPGVFGLLSRLLGEDVALLLAADYELVTQHDGNYEPAVIREEGVSYNPRIGRVLSIVIQDGGIQERDSIRSAMFACAPRLEPPEELEPLGSEVRNLLSTEPIANTIQLALELDFIRHLHMTTYSVEDRQKLLTERAQSTLIARLGKGSAALFQKVAHAITLQQRRLELDGLVAEQG